MENPNSPFGTWEPHTPLFWWFLLCFVLFKQYEDNTCSAGPREDWHQTLPLQAHWFPSLQQGQSFQVGYTLVVMVGTINTRKYEFIATEKRTFR